MTEAEARKAQAQAREFPETMEIMDRIRSALAEKLFKTDVLDKSTREEIFLRVQTLDAMKQEMEALLAASASEQDISQYIESLATTGEK
jgi:hypothetical protein